MKKIIVTQDIKAYLDLAGNFLNREEIRIIRASSNEEVPDIQKAERADVIVADLEPGGISGEALCSKIREDNKIRSVSIIIMHSGSPADLKRTARCRANAFIEKSAHPAVLADEMRRLMNIPVREAFRAPIGTEIECGSGRLMSVGYAENISTTGMLFDSETKFRKGEIISCWFVLPDSTHIRAEAEVVRVCGRETEHDPNRYGVRFMDLSDAARAAITEYIRRRQSKP